jgi:HEAT repeat protein
LHDEDAEVQYYCELALRERGLTDADLLVAREITDPNPATRMRVLHRLPQMPDLNLVEWLRQLSLDASPAVRAAAVRAAGENPSVDMRQRLQEMAEQDPCDAVRLNARYYLRHLAAFHVMNERQGFNDR